MPVGENNSRRNWVHALAGELVRLKLVARLAVALVPHPAHLPAKLAAASPLAARLLSSASRSVLGKLLAMGAHTPVEIISISLKGNVLACDPQERHGKHDCTGSEGTNTGPRHKAILRRTRLCNLEHCHKDVPPPDTSCG